MEVAPFFIDFHDLRTFVAIYILSRFTHFFRKFFLAKIAFSATSHVFLQSVSYRPTTGKGGGQLKKHPVHKNQTKYPVQKET